MGLASPTSSRVTVWTTPDLLAFFGPRRLFPGQVPTKLVAPEPYEHETFTLEGHELRIIAQGRTESPDSTSLYVPSIGLIVAGDVV
jgi:hypothetical protein